MVSDEYERLADIILHNGKVVTVDNENTVAEAVAIKMGRIVKVGTSDAVKSMIGKSTSVIDLAGRSVLPGLTDCHVHMISGAAEDLDPLTIDCRDFYHPEIKSIDDIVGKMREQARKIPKGNWIMANGSAMADFRLW